jgi:Gpi18-like mannosyltransferase
VHLPQRTVPGDRLDAAFTDTDEQESTVLTECLPQSSPGDQTSTKPTNDRPWLRSLAVSAAVWAVTHAAYAALTFFAFFQSNRPALPKSLGKAFANWGNWDAQWFVWIAQHGYTGYHGTDIDEQRSAAFFPLYSLLIKILSYVTCKPTVSAMLIAATAQLAAFAILHRLTERELDGATATRTRWFLVCFPTGFYLGLTYNASLFLLLVVAAVYLMRRGTWWGAGVVAAFATATRSSALLLFIPFAYEYLRQREFKVRRISWDVAWIALVPVGIISYALYCWRIFGDPLKFMHAQALWFRERDWPWIGIYQSFKIIFTTPNIFGNDVRNLMDLGAVLFVCVMLVLGFVGPWKFRRDQLMLPIFGVASLLFVICFPSADVINRVPLLSAGRLALEAFPAFIIVGRIGRNQIFDRAYCFIGVLLQGLWFTHFLLRHFIG